MIFYYQLKKKNQTRQEIRGNIRIDDQEIQGNIRIDNEVKIFIRRYEKSLTHQ